MIILLNGALKKQIAISDKRIANSEQRIVFGEHWPDTVISEELSSACLLKTKTSKIRPEPTIRYSLLAIR